MVQANYSSVQHVASKRSWTKECTAGRNEEYQEDAG